MSKGWWRESYRHSLAARGIKTAYPKLYEFQNKNLEYTPIRDVGESGLRIMGYGTEAAMDIYRELTKSFKDFYGYIPEKINKIEQTIKWAKLYGWGKPNNRAKREFLAKLETLKQKTNKVKNPKQRKAMKLTLDVAKYMVLGDTKKAESKFKALKDVLYDIHIVSNKVYERLSSEKKLRAKGYMSYASIETTPGRDGDYDIYVRKTPSKKALNRLIKHEKRELIIYKQLRKKGIPDHIAKDLAHKLNPVKLSNAMMDKAYGDIGNPI